MLRTALLAVALSGAIAIAAPAEAQKLPDYYPANYKDLVEASKKENTLLIYSNMAEYNWRPVIEGFNKLYPWIKVQTLDLAGELYERYYAEKASNTRTADLIATGGIDDWLAFSDKGEAVDYVSPEKPKLPDWSFPRPGIYTVSSDPMVIVYNKKIIPEAQAPKSIADLVKYAEANPAVVKNKLTTYNALTGSFGLSIYWSWLQKYPEAWSMFEKVGGITRPERSAGPMLEKITSGEYAMGYFLSGIVVFPRMNDPARKALIGWNFIEDGTPVFLRGMSVPKGSANQNAAKLMLDFILSHDGQVAFGKGGLTPYRPDVKADEVPYFTYNSIVEKVGGEKNVILIRYDPEMLKQRTVFLDKWRAVFRDPK